MVLPRFLPAALLLVVPLLVSATEFAYNDDLSCSKPISVSVDSVACADDGGVCDFGDELTSYGSVSLQSELPESTCLSVKACFMGISFVCRTYEQDNVNLCDELNLEASDDDYSCPSQGSYTYSTHVKLPSGNGLNLGIGWWVTSYITVNDCSSGSTYSTCNASFSAVSSNNSSTAAITGWSAMGFAVLGLVVYARKRRTATAARIDLRQEEQLIDFERMQDSGVVV